MSDEKEEIKETEHESTTASITDPPIEEVSLEALYEHVEGVEADLAKEQLIDTARTDGHTFNPHHAADQGLTYTPPTDPPVLPADNDQGVRVAAGFAHSMEDANPNARRVPERVEGNDLALEEDARSALRNNSESSHLDNVTVRVENGIAYLDGTVMSEDDFAIVDRIISHLDGIDEVESYLKLKD